MDRRRFLAGGAVAGCGLDPREPDLARLYAQTAAIDPAARRPIVAIPGFMGSRLRLGRDGPFLWGGPGRLSPDPRAPEALRDLALPFDGATGPTVRVDGVLRRADAAVLGGTVEQVVYDGMIAALNAGGYAFSRSEAEERARRGANPGSLEFPYDWRRDIVDIARDLDAFVERKAEEVAETRRRLYGWSVAPAEMRFDFVAHSMGALVLRWWLLHGARQPPEDGPMPAPDWSGARRAACAIFVAPPFLGSALALDSLIGGRSPGLLQPWFPPALLGTFPALHQLAPRARHRRIRIGAADGPATEDTFDVATWARHGWGLLDPAEDARLSVLLPDAPGRAARAAQAEAHLARLLRRAAQVHAALDRPTPPVGADLFLVVGTGLDTPATLVIGRDGRTVAMTREDGDGAVLRASALHDEAQGGHASGAARPRTEYRTVLLLPGEHVRLTRNAVFADNLIYWLLGAPRG
ncbi:MAG: hypothetical protein ACFCUS_13525 [Rubrimonas sp.]